MPSWEFEERAPRGGATGEAYVHTLDSSLSGEALLARESIQNSVDARDKGKKPRIRFTIKQLSGEAKRRFVDDLRLDVGFRERSKLLPKGMQSALSDLGDSRKPLSIAYVEDFNAHGLYGDPFTADAPFAKMLFSLGDASKVRDDEGSGGSYGYGKAAYFRLSRFHTIVAHSVFDPAKDPLGHRSRLLGCSFLPPHHLDAKDYTGRAWFGVNDSRPEFAALTGPLADQDADQVAGRLGFSERSRRETGTSILIVDCVLDHRDLKHAVETWWWPRLVADELDVEIVLDSGDVVSPTPKSRHDLKPYIHAFEIARGRVQASPPDEKFHTTKARDGFDRGNIALVRLEGNSGPHDPESKDVPRRAVALVRKPLMVVRYFAEERTPSPQDWAGVFLASDQADHPLKLSEPPTHDDWVGDSRRLREEGDKFPAKFVDDLFRAIRKQVTLFNKPTHEPTAQDAPRMTLLEKMLGSLVTDGAKQSGGKGPKRSLPVSIDYVSQDYSPSGNDLIVRGEVELNLSGDKRRKSLLVNATVHCLPVEDDGKGTDDPIPVKVWLGSVDGPEAESAADSVQLKVTSSDPVRLSFRTAPYDRDWAVSPQVVLEPAE